MGDSVTTSMSQVENPGTERGRPTARDRQFRLEIKFLDEEERGARDKWRISVFGMSTKHLPGWGSPGPASPVVLAGVGWDLSLTQSQDEKHREADTRPHDRTFPALVTMAAKRQGSRVLCAPSPTILGLGRYVPATHLPMQRRKGGHGQPVWW